jgi:hypothetical protein
MLDEKGIKRVIQRDDRTSVFAQYTVLLDNREATQSKLSRGRYSYGCSLPDSAQRATGLQAPLLLGLHADFA